MKRQLFVLFLALLVSAALFAGGGQAASTGGLTEVSHVVWDRGSTPAEEGTLMDNWWTRYVDGKLAPLGAKMTYIVIPRAQEAQLLSTMLAANNAPDISKTGDRSLLMTYLTGGGVADITAQVDQFGPNIKSLLGPEVMEDIKYDGKLYWIPHRQNGTEAYTTWIRKDWLDAIGMEIPSTPDEFYQVLKAIKARDPGKVGAALVPYGMLRHMDAFSFVVLQGFAKEKYTPEKLLVPYPMWPETKDALRWMNKLAAEGLYTDTFVTDSDDSIFRQKIARGEMFAFSGHGHYPYHSAYGELYDKIREHTPNAVLANISTFRQSKTDPRVEYRPANPTYGYRFFVPATSRHVDLTVKVLDFLSSDDGYLVGGLGIQGEDYTMVNNVPTPIDREKYLARVPWIESQYGLMAKPYPRAEDKELFLVNYIKDFNPIYHDQIKQEVNYLSDVWAYPPTISAPTPVDDKLRPVVNNFWGNEMTRIVFTPPADFDRVFDAAIREYKAIGGDEIVAEAQRLYAAQRR